MAADVRRRLKEFSALVGNATYLGPRWLVLRAIGVIFVFVFAGIIADARGLIGPNGIVPLGGFFTEWRQTHPQILDAVLHAPSLFWFSSREAMITTLAWGGLAAAIALVLNLWPRLALFLCWLFLLSFVSTWRGFSASQVDQLMLESALLCIPFAPAGFRPGFGHSSPPRPIAVFMVRWLLFRVMFESGLMKILAGDPRWLNLTAMDVLYETAPFPTILGYFAHQMPHAFHVGEIALTFAAEILAPLAAIFAGRRGRWFAFGVWTVFQLGIELTNNFGWLNAASIGLGFVLLDDQMIQAVTAKLHLTRLGRLLPPRAGVPPPNTSAPWAVPGLRLALGMHFCLTWYFLALNCGLPVTGFPYALARPLKTLFWDFRSANTYTLYAVLLPARTEVEFEGSNDGGETWRPYEFRYQPQRVDQISPFIAPRYARFEATLQVESTRSDPSPLFGLVAAQLLARNASVTGFFKRDAFPERGPTIIRMPVHRLTFTDLATHRQTGHYWRKEFVGYYRPAMYLDEQERIVEPASALEEIRLRAGQGSAHAQNLIGFAYANGNDVERDHAKAAMWYRKAAEQGLAEAQARLGYCYAYGEGVPRDIRMAAEWFRKAADQGDAQSQFFMGLCCATGEGAAQDYAAAARYYRLAALQGNALAQTNLGFLYSRGQGFPKDEIEALAWFNVAAQSGNREAMKIQEAYASRATADHVALARQRSEAIKTEIEAVQRAHERDPRSHR